MEEQIDSALNNLDLSDSLNNDWKEVKSKNKSDKSKTRTKMNSNGSYEKKKNRNLKRDNKNDKSNGIEKFKHTNNLERKKPPIIPPIQKKNEIVNINRPTPSKDLIDPSLLSSSTPSKISPKYLNETEFIKLLDDYSFENAPNLNYVPRRLINKNAACFRNSVIQCLVHIPQFINLFDFIISNSPNGIVSERLPFWNEMIGLMKEFLGFSNHFSLSSDDPILIEALLPRICEDFDDYCENDRSNPSQQDAMEFLTFLIDGLNEELNRVTSDQIANQTPLQLGVDKNSNNKNSDTHNLDDNRNIDLGDDDDDGWCTVTKSKTKTVVDNESKSSSVRLTDSTTITKLFYGSLRNEVNYLSKKLTSTTFQPFHCLSLNIDSASSQNTLNDSVRAYFREEVLSDAKIKKRLSLNSLPQVLLLHLNKYSFDYSKNIPVKVQKYMEYPFNLNITEDLVSDELCESLKLQYQNKNRAIEHGTLAQYQLQSVILHHGKRATSGHYSIVTKEPNNKWKTFNDTKISSLHKDDIALSYGHLAYIWIYIRNL